MVLCLLATACASWKQKDFEKSLEAPVPESKPDVQVKDKKILEKFEVKDNKPAVAEVKKEEPIVVITKKPPPEVVKKVIKAPPAKVIPPKVSEKKEVPLAVKGPPKNYPPELLPVNEKGKSVWSVYKPNHQTGKKVFLDIHYLGMTVGKIMVVNQGKKMVNGKEAWHFHARFKSAPFYSNIYELDDTVDTYVLTENFMSVRYSLIQRESKQSVDDLQLHDRDALKTFWFYKQKKSDGKIKNKDVKKPIPYFSIDPFSVLFFYQGLPLRDGDNYEIPIINKGKILILTTLVEGRETIETELGDKKAIRVHATTKYSGTTLKSGDLYFWFSDDKDRTLLKASAKIKIGSVTADIVNN
jgi:hypothetical protein